MNHEPPATKPTANGSGEDLRIKNPKLIGMIAISQHIAWIRRINKSR